MSNIIENDHLWTLEEVEYQIARGREKEVETNRLMYGEGGEREGQDDREPEPEHGVLQLDQDIYDHVVGLGVPGLQEELKSLGVSTKGNEQELRSKLAQALQDQRDDEPN